MRDGYADLGAELFEFNGGAEHLHLANFPAHGGYLPVGEQPQAHLFPPPAVGVPAPAPPLLLLLLLLLS